MPGPVRGFVHLGSLTIVLGFAVAAGPAAEEAPARAYAGRPLIEVLRELQVRGLRLIYSSDVVRPVMQVEVEPSGREPREVLDEILGPHGLEALEGPGETLLVVPRTAGTAGDISGIVRTPERRHPAAAARVRVGGTTLQAIASRDGRFRIAGVPAGTHTLIVTVPGWPSERFKGVMVRPGDRTDVTLDLAAASTILERVVVTPRHDASSAARPDSGRIVEADGIRREPAMGEDLQRAIAAQPGIAAADSSAEIRLRGGEPNEVLIQLDGLELYDPFHLKGFQRFSGILDSMAVSSAEYFPGGFPAEYGDHLSGVLDLSSSIPAAPRSTFFSGSFINSRFMTDGTFREGAGHWLVSARAWYPDAVVRTTDREREGFAPSYYDLLGKIQMPVGERGVLRANVLSARDEVEFIDPDGEESVNAESGARYAWLTLHALLSPRLYSRTLFSLGRIGSRRNGRIEEDTESLASVDDRRSFDVAGLDQDWSYRPSERLLVKWGVRGRWLDAEYDYAGRTAEPAPPPGDGLVADPSSQTVVLEPSGRQFGSYVAGQFRPTGPLQFEIGLRWDRQTYTGGDQISPRVSVVHGLGPTSRLRAGWGRYSQSQGIHELQVEDGVTDFHPAQLAEQWSLGYEHEFRNGVALRADAYVKTMPRMRPRFENLFNPFELLPELQPDRVRIAPDRAEARGLDLTVERDREGPFAWWATYSRSSTRDEIDGRAVPRSWDQPHAFRFGLHVRKGDVLSVTLAGTYHTGWPTTAVGAVAVEEPGGTTTFEPLLGPRNGARYPAYHRLDLRASRRFRLGRGRLTVFAEITNLYGRENVCCVEDVTFVPQADGSVRVLREDGLWLQRVPSLGFAWAFDR